MKNKIFFIFIMIFSLSILASCSDKKLDKEAQGVVNGIMADESFNDGAGWTEKNAICWVQKMRKSVNDEEWQNMRIIYDPNVKGNFDVAKMLELLPKMYAAAGECKVKLPA